VINKPHQEKKQFDMKEITISFSTDELIELAKQLYMASYLTIGFPYDNQEMMDEIFNKVCATGFLEAPESEAFRHGGLMETDFHISFDLADGADAVVKEFQVSAVEKHLPYALADRDFLEKYGKMEALDVLNNTKLRTELMSIQDKYKLEIERYDVLHLRLEEGK